MRGRHEALSSSQEHHLDGVRIAPVHVHDIVVRTKRLVHVPARYVEHREIVVLDVLQDHVITAVNRPPFAIRAEQQGGAKLHVPPAIVIVSGHRGYTVRIVFVL